MKTLFIAIFLAFFAISPFAAIADHNEAHTIQQLQEQVAALQSAIIAILNAAASRPEDPTSKAQAPIEVAQPLPGTGTQAVPAQPAQVPTTTPAPLTSSGQATPAQPATPAIPATPTTPATPASSAGTAQPATPAVPAVSDKPSAIPQTASQRESAFQNVREQLQAIQNKVNELRLQSPAPKPIPAFEFKPAPITAPFPPSAQAPALELTKPLKRGSSGDDVKQLQGFLSRFPDIYPTGIANGNFGPATENAVKKLQEKFGIEQPGFIGPKTQKKLKELSQAVQRKQPPKISGISPAEISVDTKVTISGSGFTLENNSLFVKGKTILSRLISQDGTEIVFSLPGDLPCEVGKTCPIKIANANGISNAKPFKLVEISQMPEPEPIVIPSPSPAVRDTIPPVRSNGAPTGILPAGTASATISLVTDENATCKYSVDASGINYAEMPNTFSNTNSTLHSSSVALSPTRYTSYDTSYGFNVRCQDSAGNANIDDYLINFWVAKNPLPPTIASISPSYGNTGTSVTITGAGFTASGNDVHFVDIPTDPHAIVSNLVSSDGFTLTFIVPSNLPCNELENCSVFVKNINGASNSILFFRVLTVVPVQVLSPNGGETVVGTTLHYSGGNFGLYVGIAAETATNNSDPSEHILGWVWSTAPGDRTIGWDGKTLCGFPGCNSTTTRWTIGPGKYKVIASSHNEFGKTYLYDPATGKLGNFDLSDGPFSVVAAPTPMVTLISPNGGETYKYGDSVTITWEAKDIVAKSVNIKLLKAGALSMNIASNVAQSAETGLFIYNWVIPSYIAVGSDYSIEISDSSNSSVKDVSDSQFRISNLAALQIYGPNGGETTMKGFATLLFWNYSGYTPATINVNLYKGGTFYRTLASGVKPVGFSGYTFLREPYPYNSRYAEIPLPLDLPDGEDYTLEIIDGVDSSIRDLSDAPFKIMTLPSPITFKGRLIDALTGVGMANVGFGGYSGNVRTDGTYQSVTLPRFSTDANGAFSYSTTTSGLVSDLRSLSILAAWPSCHDAFTMALSRYLDMPRTGFGGWYDKPYQADSVRKQRFPLTTPVIDFGDIQDWPSAPLFIYSDVPVKHNISYGSSGTGSSLYQTVQGNTAGIPLDYDFSVQLTDQSGKIVYSPYVRLSKDNGCVPKVLSYVGGQASWEPYTLDIDPPGYSTNYSGGTAYVGTAYSGKLPGVTAGVAPYTWSILYGSLPSGFVLDGTNGIISGTATAAGSYPVTLKVTDANGVNVALVWTLTVK